MAEPLIAIVGSADAKRATELELKNLDHAEQAARDIGAELAGRGCRIVVYSDKPTFTELQVVLGYIASGKAKERSIRVIYPVTHKQPDFHVDPKWYSCFDFVPDPKPQWEISFYESLRDVDGVVLIGGGRSTLFAGIYFVMNRRPALVLAGFGGSAGEVWKYLSESPSFAEKKELDLMAQETWTAESARLCVESLINQRARRAAEAERRRQAELAQARTMSREGGIAAFLLIAAVVTAALMWDSERVSYKVLLVLLFTSPLVTGVSGALIRRIFDALHGASPASGKAGIISALGLAAGGLAGMTYVLAQLSAFPDLKGVADNLVEAAKVSLASKMLPTVMLTGFVGGLTLDSVLRKLIQKGVSSESG
jgi:hypothetical protein